MIDMIFNNEAIRIFFDKENEIIIFLYNCKSV